MRWSRLLFAHWPIEPARLRPLVPARLTLDLFSGTAWLGVVPFLMDLAVRGLPLLRHTPELNVRTYVRHGGLAGVYFMSLDLQSVAGTLGARIGFGLPYWCARALVVAEDDTIRYWLRRTAAQAEFLGSYRGEGAAMEPQPGTLEHFLVERYCLFNVEGKRLYRMDIHHSPWRLEAAVATLATNTMTEPLGLRLSPDPLCHYVAEQHVLAWWPERIE